MEATRGSTGICDDGAMDDRESDYASFFAVLKGKVIDAYYTSEIGIKQEMEYKGNGYLAEFEGVDVSK